MADLIDLARARRSRVVWGGVVSLKPDEEGRTVAEMTDFWGDDLNNPSDRLSAWADGLDALSRQMRATAAALKSTAAQHRAEINAMDDNAAYASECIADLKSTAAKEGGAL